MTTCEIHISEVFCSMNVRDRPRRRSYSCSTIPVSSIFGRNWKYVGKNINDPDYYIKCSYSDDHDCSGFKFQDNTQTCCEGSCNARLKIVCLKCKDSLSAKTSRKKVQQNMRDVVTGLVEKGKLRKSRGTGRRFVERKLKENRIKKPLAGDDQFGCQKCKQLPLLRQELEIQLRRIETLRQRVSRTRTTRGSKLAKNEAIAACCVESGRGT